jgi:DNA-binding CsgD family transcriptional regulator
VAAIDASDMRRILHFLDFAATATGPEPLPLATLVALGELIPADEVSYFELAWEGRQPGASVEERDRAVVSHSTTGEPPVPPGAEEALAMYSHQNPVGAFVSGFRPADGAVRQSRVISRRELLRLGYYHECMKPIGLRDTLKVWLHRSPATVACVAFERMDGEFSDRDEAILGVLQSHLGVLRQNALARRAPPPRADVQFTPREAEVLSWAVRGKRNDEIAQLLFISAATVRKHLDHAYEKLGVHSRTEALWQLNLPTSQPPD